MSRSGYIDDDGDDPLAMGRWRGRVASAIRGKRGQQLLRDLLWVVYIVQCSDGSLYTGITNNLEKRLKAHNDGKGGGYTRSRKPVILVWRAPCASKSGALKWEAKIKRMSRKGKLFLVEHQGINWPIPITTS